MITPDSVFLSPAIIDFKSILQQRPNKEAIYIFVDQDNKVLGSFAQSLQYLIDGSFVSKFGYARLFTQMSNDKIVVNIVAVNICDPAKLDYHKASKIGRIMYEHIKDNKFKQIGVSLDFCDNLDYVHMLIHSIISTSYKFIKYKTQDKEHDIVVNSLTFYAKNELTADALKKSFDTEGKALVEGMVFAKDCTYMAPNDLYPATYAKKIEATFKGISKVKVKVYDSKYMSKLNMGALLGVGQGSVNSARMVVVEYKGSTNQDPFVAFVGKGVTFDTGGISLKPSSGMEKMKYDMAGSAACLGALLSIAKRKAKLNVVAIVGLVENMPGGNAIKPGDVLTSMSGKTIEVLNTDAEGRLVLADLMWYVQNEFKVDVMVDVATLTGAILVSLGNTYVGCFCDDEALLANIQQAGKKTNQQVWHMPLHQDYDDAIKSSIADLSNIPPTKGYLAGSSTAAQFLQHFKQDQTKWAHLDIACVTDNAADKKGFGVRLLNELAKNYEAKPKE